MTLSAHLPGGGRGREERCATAAVREAYEELGLAVTLQHWLGDVDEGAGTVGRYYVGRVMGGTPLGTHAHEGVTLRAERIPVAEAMRLLPPHEAEALRRVVEGKALLREAGENCGTGSGGFQPGNTCAKGEGGGVSERVADTGVPFTPELRPQRKESTYALGKRLAKEIPADARVWVYHVTDAATAKRFGEEGVKVSDKPSNFNREMYEQGEPDKVFYQPGAGLASGLTVGLSPQDIDGYGRALVAVKVRFGDIQSSPEAAQLGNTKGAEALAANDAHVPVDIPASDVKVIPPGADTRAWKIPYFREDVPAEQVKAEAKGEGKAPGDSAAETARIQSYRDPDAGARVIEKYRARHPRQTGAERELAETQEVDFLREQPLQHGAPVEAAIAMWRDGIRSNAEVGVKGRTGAPDRADGLDRFVFAYHGAIGDGEVSVLIDNAALDDPGAFATPSDIIHYLTGDAMMGNDAEKGYPEATKRAYGAEMVSGEDYWRAAGAGRAASLRNEWSREDPTRRGSMEVKIPSQPASRIVGFLAGKAQRDALIAGGVPADRVAVISDDGKQRAALAAEMQARHRRPLREAFDPNQPRDENGQWTSSGGGVSVGERQTDTPAFKAWFGDSKVVDREGKPLVLYHGTTAEVEEFDRGDLGFHVGTVEQAQHRLGGTPLGANVLPVYVALQNPLRMRDVKFWGSDAIDELERIGVATAEEAKRLTSAYNNDPTTMRGAKRMYARTAPIRAFLQSKGYDGIVYRNDIEGEGDSYIAFEPEQVKSAIGNRGTFDPKSRKLSEAFDPSQPRDEEGRWTDTGAAGRDNAVRELRSYARPGRPEREVTVDLDSGVQSPSPGTAGRIGVVRTRRGPTGVEDKDWRDFANPRVRQLSVIGSDGTTYTITKTPDFDRRPPAERDPEVMAERWGSMLNEAVAAVPDVSDDSLALAMQAINEQVAEEFGVSLQVTPPDAETYASPNISDENSPEKAERNFNSDAHRAWQQVCQDIDTELGLNAQQEATYGDWIDEQQHDGSEVAVRTSLTGEVDWDTLRYSAALKGLAGKQKMVALFQADETAGHAKVELSLPAHWRDVREVLTEAGIENRTLIPAGDGTRIVLLDQSEGLDIVTKAMQIGTQYGVTPEITIGRVDFVGDWGDRDTARRNYEAEIAAYTSKYPLRRHAQVRDPDRRWLTESEFDPALIEAAFAAAGDTLGKGGRGMRD